MIAELLREDVGSIEVDEPVSKAINILNRYDISELAVTDNNRYSYLLRELDVLSSGEKIIANISVEKEGYYVYEDDHFLHALIKMNTADLSIIPVISRDLEYKGVIRKSTLLDYFCDSYSLSGEGSIIIIEQNLRDYSLTSISNIIEQEGGKILGVITAPLERNTEKIWISLKLNTIAIGSIISSLERYEYVVVAQMSSDENENMIKERYESLMNFLNV